MEMVNVDSANLSEIGYDPDTKKLHVVFNNGALYHYEDVPQETYDELVESDSIGSFFHEEVRYSFNYVRVE